MSVRRRHNIRKGVFVTSTPVPPGFVAKRRDNAAAAATIADADGAEIETRSRLASFGIAVSHDNVREMVGLLTRREGGIARERLVEQEFPRPGLYFGGSGNRTRNPSTMSLRANSVCCFSPSPGRSRTRNGSMLLARKSIAARWSAPALINDWPTQGNAISYRHHA